MRLRNHSEDEIADRHELDALERQNARFRVLHTLSRTADRGWQGAAGRIHRGLIQEAALNLDGPIYYVSGTPSMVVGTWRLLREMGIPEGEIEVEAFRGYT